ncbi:hypothetical protein GCM10010912_42860 [Paenibacillus albidus]|uniref:Uncharacterized protein n=1 Tax=Paenibacillus albidus TaxID=2041023 RepID=A0A917CMJ7_9BACL|nr:hypothetical protein [Paenibacillus albidus]GGF93302.1 hypothetical protein GCM10010912_42860 [Paenibacillus albidus]
MANEDKTKEPSVSRWFTPEGKPIRVLSTSLGIALLANAMYIPGAVEASGNAAADEPQLVSWSTEEVKAYFDKNVDWNIPYPEEEPGEAVQQPEGVSTSNGTTVVNNYNGYNSGFGWDDVLLYHMLFNSGSNYSSRGWHNNRPTYYPGTRNTYKAPTYDSGKFQNKNVPGSVAKPRTSTSSTGSITRRSTSSKSGGIGGKSSGLGSSSSSSSSSSKSSSKSSSRSSSKSGFGG